VIGFGSDGDIGRHLPRRAVLGGLAALAAGAGSRPVRAAGPPHRIDVHHHLSPPAYIAELAPEKKLAQPTLDWTPARAIEEMDEGGVATSITSITTPGLWFGEAGAARKLARACNDYAAKLVSDQPRRFGMFVNLPLPDIDGSLMEIAYGLDQLKADGVAMFTSYGDKWLGDPAFAPVFEELNRRKALVYTHPTSNDCCRNLDPGLNDSVIEYGADTTRAIARMVFSGSSSRYPDLRMIFSHAGGTMPYLIGRLERIAAVPPNAAVVPKGFRFEARRFYYDVAQTSQPGSLFALRNVMPVSHILFGTDYPFLTAALHVKELENAGVFSAQELQAIDRGNAARLMPRYRVI
jgi:predicted TIM-barrel fold metal-dependent hydrolase